MTMTARSWRQLSIWILRAHIVAWVANFVFLAFLVLALDFDFFMLIGTGYFPKMLLLEAGIVFLVGGGIAFSSSIFAGKVREHVLHSEEKWSIEKLIKGEKRADLYILAGIFFFVESIAVSFVFV